MPRGLSVAGSRFPGLPPGGRKQAIEQAATYEVLEERAESSRGQSKPRGVKGTMSE